MTNAHTPKRPNAQTPEQPNARTPKRPNAHTSHRANAALWSHTAPVAGVDRGVDLNHEQFGRGVAAITAIPHHIVPRDDALRVRFHVVGTCFMG